MSAYGNYSCSGPNLDSYSGPNLESYSGPNLEPFANLSNTVRGQRVDAFEALPSARRARLRFSRQYLVVALALGLVVGLPIVSAQATYIHQTGNFPGGLVPTEFTVDPAGRDYGSGATVTWSLMPTNQNPGDVFGLFHDGGISHLSAFMGGAMES